MLIMREAYYGTTRFDDFARRVGITKAATSTRLSELVDAGLLAKRPYREPGQRSRDEYVLTEAGTDFMPVVWAMFEWGRTHLNDTGLRLVAGVDQRRRQLFGPFVDADQPLEIGPLELAHDERRLARRHLQRHGGIRRHEGEVGQRLRCLLLVAAAAGRPTAADLAGDLIGRLVHDDRFSLVPAESAQRDREVRQLNGRWQSFPHGRIDRGSAPRAPTKSTPTGGQPKTTMRTTFVLIIPLGAYCASFS